MTLSERGCLLGWQHLYNLCRESVLPVRTLSLVTTLTLHRHIVTVLYMYLAFTIKCMCRHKQYTVKPLAVQGHLPILFNTTSYKLVVYLFALLAT